MTSPTKKAKLKPIVKIKDLKPKKKSIMGGLRKAGGGNTTVF